MSDEECVAWLKAQVEADMSAARIISAGGFEPQRWDTDPPGQVNPPSDPGSAAVSTAISQEPEYSCGWVRIAVYEREIGEPPEAEELAIGSVAAIADRGRRQFDHIIRHDPQDVVADCEAKLALLDEHGGEHMCFSNSRDGNTWDWWIGDCRVMTAVASAYRYREGYAEHWGALAAKG